MRVMVGLRGRKETIYDVVIISKNYFEKVETGFMTMFSRD